MKSKRIWPLFKAAPSNLRISRPGGSRKQKILLILLLLLCLVIGSAVVFAYQIKTKIDHMLIPPTMLTERYTFPEPDEPLDQPSPPGTPSIRQSVESPRIRQESDDERYVLVMGLDYREGHNALLTDTLLVMHIIPEQSRIKLLSVPRDLMVTNAAGQRVKINSLIYEGYQLARKIAQEHPDVLTGEEVRAGPLKMDKAILGGAMAHTRNKIEEILALRIDHMMLVSFETVTALVDAVGGIEIQVNRSMEIKDLDFFLEPGVHLLDGNHALAYARYRKDTRGKEYYVSDFERVRNQQQIVKAIARKILSWNSVAKALEILDILSDNVKTDMNYASMYAMIRNYYGLFHQDSFVSVPFPEHYTSDGQVTIPKEALDQLRESFRAPI